MRNADVGPSAPGREATDPAPGSRDPIARPGGDPPGQVIMTEVSPFHCLYQDALEFHSQSRLMLGRSMSAASRLARASLLLYLSAAEALVHQAASELARSDLARLIADPARPLPLADAWRLLPAIATGTASTAVDPEAPPWPQFAELLALKTAWEYPGAGVSRRAYYRQSTTDTGFEPLLPHQIPAGLAVTPETLQYPRTGLPRDPYALRPHHLDTARGVLDLAVEALDRRLDGALTRDNRHRRERIKVVHPPG